MWTGGFLCQGCFYSPSLALYVLDYGGFTYSHIQLLYLASVHHLLFSPLVWIFLDLSSRDISGAAGRLQPSICTMS